MWLRGARSEKDNNGGGGAKASPLDRLTAVRPPIGARALARGLGRGAATQQADESRRGMQAVIFLSSSKRWPWGRKEWKRGRGKGSCGAVETGVGGRGGRAVAGGCCRRYRAVMSRPSLADLPKTRKGRKERGLTWWKPLPVAGAAEPSPATGPSHAPQREEQESGAT